jgi:hypothetical protein
MTNEYGLDVNYFKGKLKLIVRDLDRYTPAELFRELSRLSLTASDQADMNVEVKILNDHRHI